MSNGTHLAARPTTYNGVKMRSRLEARYARWLDVNGFQWSYEPRCFATQDGQYLPDFQLEAVRFLGREWPAFVEVKPTWDKAPMPLMVANAGIVHASEPGALFIIECAECGWPVVILPPSHGGGALDTQWARETTGTPSLVFIAEPLWRSGV